MTFSHQSQYPYRAKHQYKAKPSLLPGKPPSEWIHVGETGTHVYCGFEMELTETHFDEFIKNFDAQVNPIPVYFNHLMGEAAGWILELKREGGDLFAFAEFVSDVAADIKKGAWCFTSMGFDLESESRKDGEPIGAELFEVSLTNEPFLDGLEPIKLSKSTRNKRYVQMTKKEQHKDGAPSTRASARKTLDTGGNDETKFADGEQALAMLMEATGLGAEEVMAAIVANLEAVVAALTGTGESTGEMAALGRENAGLKIKLNALEKRVTDLDAKEAARADQNAQDDVDAWVTEGKVLVHERDHALTLRRQDPDLARSIFGEREPVVPTQTVASTPAPADPSGATYAALSDRNKTLVNGLLRFARNRDKDALARRVLESQAKQRRQAQERADA